MKTLPKTFKRESWEYKLIRRNKFAAIYEMKRDHETYREYEVWKLRYYKKDNPKMNIEAGDIHCPSTKEWGRYGWSYPFLHLAEWKFILITEEMSETKH